MLKNLFSAANRALRLQTVHGSSPYRYLILRAAVLAILLLLLVSCGFRDPLARLPKTPENIHLESFAPAKSFLVASVFPTSKEEKSMSARHIEAAASAYRFAAPNVLFSKLFQKEIAGILANMVLKIGMPETLFSLQADETQQNQVTFLAAMRFAETAELRGEFVTLRDLQLPDLVIREEGEKIFIEQKNPQRYGLLIPPYFFASSSLELLPDALPLNTKAGGLIDDKLFLEYLKKAPPAYSGYAYLKVPAGQGGMSFLPGGLNLTPNLPIPGETASIAFVSAEQEGFRFSGFAKMPNSKNIDPLLRESFTKAATTLTAKIPVQNPALYLEGANLGNQLRIQKKALMDDPFFAVRYGEKFLQNLEKTLGFSLEKDLLPVLSRNYALVLEDQGKILPALSLWIDASANPDGATKIMKQLDSAISSFAALSQMALVKSKQESESGKENDGQPATPVFEQKTIDFQGATLKKLIFYPQRFAETQRPTPLFESMNEIWEIIYGLTKDHLIVLSTRSDFGGTQPISDLSPYQTLLPLIKGFSQTDHLFVDLQPFIAYAERVMATSELTENFTAEQRQGFEFIKQFAAPFKGLISGMRQKGDWIETQGFLAIGNVAK